MRVRKGLGTPYRKLASVRFALTRDRDAIVRFLGEPGLLTRRERLRLVYRFYDITNHVRAYHTQAEMLAVTSAILGFRGRRPIVVEAGAALGASTAKLSLAVQAAGGELHVFDSFRGIPENEEVHQSYDGRTVRFRKGAFTGRLNAVRRAVAARGAPEVCTFHKGWFEQTLPAFAPSTVHVALLDVDLWSSTDTCLRHLAPRLSDGGTLFSQDGHLRTIAERLTVAAYWTDTVGIEPPQIHGLGEAKLLRIEALRSAPPAG